MYEKRKIFYKLGIFILILFWLLSGWPVVWQSADRRIRIPPGIKVTKASPDIETKQPQTHTAVPVQTTNPEYAYDATGNTTQSDTEYDANAIPAVAFWNWPSAGQTYTALTLKVEYEAQAALNDTYEIEYSTDNTSGQCDSATWTDLVAPTSVLAADHTLVSATLSASQDLTKICVRLNTDKVTGPDNAHVYIEDIRTEGEYTPVTTSIAITTDGTIAYGNVEGGQSKSTIDLTDTQTAQNDSSITENFNIMTSNAVNGTSWTIGSSAGDNVFVHEFSTNAGSEWTKFTAADSYQTLATGVEVSGTVDFDLRITVPTSSDGNQKTITITVQAVAP